METENKAWVDWSLEHPKLAGLLAAIALAIGFSPKVSPMAAWVFILLAIAFAISMLRGFALKYKWKKLTLWTAFGAAVVALVVFGVWLTETKTGDKVTIAPSEQHPASDSVKVGAQHDDPKDTVSPEVKRAAPPLGATVGAIQQGAGSIAQIGGNNNQASVTNNIVPKARVLASSVSQTQTGNGSWATSFVITATDIVPTGILRVTCDGPITGGRLEMPSGFSGIGKSSHDRQNPNTFFWEVIGPESISQNRGLRITVFSVSRVKVNAATVGQMHVEFTQQ